MLQTLKKETGTRDYIGIVENEMETIMSKQGVYIHIYIYMILVTGHRRFGCLKTIIPPHPPTMSPAL